MQRAELKELMLRHTSNNKQSHALKLSSDRLTLLSYAIFNYHIPIYDYSSSTWRQHQWKQADTMVALAKLALQSAKKLFQKDNFKTKYDVLALSGADVHARSVGIDPSFRIKLCKTPRCSAVTGCIPKHNTCKASLALTLYIFSNGRLLLLTQGCVYANRAESITNGWDFFPLSDVYIGRICSFRETVYDLLGL